MFTFQRSTLLFVSAVQTREWTLENQSTTSDINYFFMSMMASQVLSRSFISFNVMMQCCDCSNNCLSDCEVKVLFGLLLTAEAVHSQTLNLGGCHKPSVQENFNVTKVKVVLFLDFWQMTSQCSRIAEILSLNV